MKFWTVQTTHGEIEIWGSWPHLAVKDGPANFHLATVEVDRANPPSRDIKRIAKILVEALEQAPALSDLVVKLRKAKRLADELTGAPNVQASLWLEAAEEIERLRGLLWALSDTETVGTPK